VRSVKIIKKYLFKNQFNLIISRLFWTKFNNIFSYLFRVLEIGLYRKFDRKTETVLFLALKMANFRLKCTWVSDLVLYLLFWNSGSFRTLVSQICSIKFRETFATTEPLFRIKSNFVFWNSDNPKTRETKTTNWKLLSHCLSLCYIKMMVFCVY